MIERITPSIGYMEPDIYEAFAYSEVVKAGNTLYLSGGMPLRGSAANPEVIGKGDMRAQLEYILETMGKVLNAAGATYANVVNTTFITTDLAALGQNADLIRKVFGDCRPATTYLQAAALFHPDQLLEVNATAYLE